MKQLKKYNSKIVIAISTRITNFYFECSFVLLINQFQCYQTLLMDYNVGISFNNTINVIFRKIKVAVSRSISFLW